MRRKAIQLQVQPD